LLPIINGCCLEFGISLPLTPFWLFINRTHTHSHTHTHTHSESLSLIIIISLFFALRFFPPLRIEFGCQMYDRHTAVDSLKITWFIKQCQQIWCIHFVQKISFFLAPFSSDTILNKKYLWFKTFEKKLILIYIFEEGRLTRRLCLLSRSDYFKVRL